MNDLKKAQVIERIKELEASISVLTAATAATEQREDKSND